MTSEEPRTQEWCTCGRERADDAHQPCEYVPHHPGSFLFSCSSGCKHHPFNPAPAEDAPEETVETPDERFLFAVCSICGARIPTRADYVAHQGAHPADSPAPEPAGEAEERLEHDDNAEYCAACGEFPPAPSTGTSGLTEAQEGEWARRTSTNRLGEHWRWRHRNGDTFYIGQSFIPHIMRAAIAAEARAPLVEEVDALNRVIAMRSEAHLLAEARAEDAERKLEAMREALKAIMDSPGSATAIQLKLMAERALTTPASTAQGDEG